VLTLRKLLEAVADYDRRVEVAIETKHPTRYGGLVERRVADMLHDFGWNEPSGGEPSPARVMSFSHAALQRMERLAPSVRLVQLVERPGYWPFLSRLLGADWAVGPGIELLTRHPRLAERIVATGHDVHVWTVNTEPELRRCQDLGVKAIITDRPAYMLELLGK
jgi:glycerophosphoryl diester phosphodiesterase